MKENKSILQNFLGKDLPLANGYNGSVASTIAAMEARNKENGLKMSAPKNSEIHSSPYDLLSYVFLLTIMGLLQTSAGAKV